jgi:hypothetical protein
MSGRSRSESAGVFANRLGASLWPSEQVSGDECTAN